MILIYTYALQGVVSLSTRCGAGLSSLLLTASLAETTTASGFSTSSSLKSPSMKYGTWTTSHCIYLPLLPVRNRFCLKVKLQFQNLDLNGSDRLSIRRGNSNFFNYSEDHVIIATGIEILHKILQKNQETFWKWFSSNFSDTFNLNQEFSSEVGFYVQLKFVCRDAAVNGDSATLAATFVSSVSVQRERDCLNVFEGLFGSCRNRKKLNWYMYVFPYRLHVDSGV